MRQDEAFRGGVAQVSFMPLDHILKIGGDNEASDDAGNAADLLTEDQVAFLWCDKEPTLFSFEHFRNFPYLAALEIQISVANFSMLLAIFARTESSSI